MGNTKAEVTDFLKKCAQLRTSKFIMATTHIKAILKSIANSAALYGLFSEVTANFDYISAKQKYFVGHGDRYYGRNRMVLPEDTAERLAFTFCLLVEFDRGDLNFNDFLQRYFAVDGSYFSSFQDFCDKVILGMEDIIRTVFASELSENDTAKPFGKEGNGSEGTTVTAQSNVKGFGNAEKFSAVSVLISSEKNYIASLEMSKAEKDDGFVMLDALLNAVREDNADAADAILRGYEYYSICHKNFSKLYNKLIATIGR